jgi:hypothetical protein
MGSIAKASASPIGTALVHVRPIAVRVPHMCSLY